MNESTIRQINESTIKAIMFYYYLMTTAGCIIGVVSFLALRMDWIIWYSSMFVILHIVWMAFLVKSKYVTEKYFIPHYYIYMVTYLFVGILALWQAEVYSIILLYMLLPLIILFRYNNFKYTIYAGISSVFFIVVIIVISIKVQLFQTIANKNMISFLNIFILFAAMSFIVLFLYYYSKILNKANDEIEQKEKTQETNNVQLKELYDNVIAYFEKEKPYSQPNYRLAMLAAELNSDTKHLSEAINSCYGGTFDSFLNKYRLEFVKKMLDEHLAEKYTIAYIYTLAGYSSRTTFYDNFRKTFKMSPMDYLEMKKLKFRMCSH